MTIARRYLYSLPALLLPALLPLGACIEPSQPTNGDELAVSQQPLIGGTIDADDPAVVALTRGGDSSFCTGTLISPRVVLTAAHCLDMLGSDPSAAIYFGSDTRGAGQKIAVGQKKKHPMWSGEIGAYDIGMMLMDFPHPDPSIAHQLNTASAADGHIGADYRHVGFGVYDRTTGDADGQKRTGTTTISSVQGDIIRSGDSEVSVCFGDSGGPAFLTIDGVELVAGVHSFTTGQECFPPNGDTNVQLYAEDFILPWIQANDPSCGLDGVCGPVGCADDPDCLPCGPDGTCVADCDLPDPDCQTQELGEICRAASQCISGVCAAYRADRDYRFCTESCSPGSDTCPKGMSCEDVIPFGNICYWDDDPAGVLGDSCDEAAQCGSYKCSDGQCVIPCDLSVGLTCPDAFDCKSPDDGANYFCFGQPKSDGGCSVSGGRGATGFGLVVLALLGLGRKRRKRAAARH